MELTVMERLVLRGGDILPVEGSGADMRVAGALREAFDFTAAERDRWHLRQDGGNWVWDTFLPDTSLDAPAVGDEDKRPLIEIPQGARFNIGERGTDLIKRGLLRLDTEKKISGSMVTLYEKFVLEQGETEDIVSRPSALNIVPVQASTDSIPDNTSAPQFAELEVVAAPTA